MKKTYFKLFIIVYIPLSGNHRDQYFWNLKWETWIRVMTHAVHSKAYLSELQSEHGIINAIAILSSLLRCDSVEAGHLHN